MKCEICGVRIAIIHIQQIAGNESIDLHLCESCAVERGITSSNERIELSIANLLTGLIDVRKLKGNTKTICPQCGSSWEEIIQKDKMGCSECYTVFNKEIRSLLNKTVGKIRHRGKYPKRLLKYKTILVDVIELKDGLKEAIKREEYEKAAALRDRIKELETSPEER